MSNLRLNDKVIIIKDIDGTGIKKGHEGWIIYIQDDTRDLNRFTDLSYDFQVRFKNGAQIWVKRTEIISVAGSDMISETADPEEEPVKAAKRSRRKRIENFDIIFKDGLAEGWAFGVPESFKDQLDILSLEALAEFTIGKLKESKYIRVNMRYVL
jgi:hypothetical protein